MCECTCDFKYKHRATPIHIANHYLEHFGHCISTDFLFIRSSCPVIFVTFEEERVSPSLTCSFSSGRTRYCMYWFSECMGRVISNGVWFSECMGRVVSNGMWFSK